MFLKRTKFTINFHSIPKLWSIGIANDIIFWFDFSGIPKERKGRHNLNLQSEMNHPIYLDYNATTPIIKQVADEMLPYLYEHFGNPSSSHIYGKKTKLAITEARKRVSIMLGCSPEEIIFTSGGTESNNLAIKGFAMKNRDRGNHIITSKIEHPAVLDVCRYLEKHGFDVTYLDVDKWGLISLEQLRDAITTKTIMITIMHANNEVGTIQPISEICKIAREKNIIVHTDASQSVGKVDIDVKSMDADLLTVCGHKFYAPKGVGSLYIRKGIILEKQTHGAPHESNIRPGTENVLEIVGLGKACELITSDLKNRISHMKEMVDILLNELERRIPGKYVLNGHPELRLVNTASIAFHPDVANRIMEHLGDFLVVSAGSACHSGSHTISSVLKAMKIPEEQAKGTLRFSTGIHTTKQEILLVCEKIQSIM